MALIVANIERKFVFEKDREEIDLPEINKDMSPQEVMDYYSLTYPELTSALVDGPHVKGDHVQYRFITKLGEKG